MTKTLDFTKIFKKYKGKWVALTENEKKVVSFGRSAKETLKKAKEKGLENPVLFKVPVSLLPYIGGNSIFKII
jgi:hypothetical protein